MTALFVSPSYNPRVSDDSAVAHFLSPRDYDVRARAIAQKNLKPVEKAAAAAGVSCDAMHAYNDFPYEEIVRAARRGKCDLIFMASHGRRGISRLLLGSETSKVLAHSKIPVLVVR
ncbi:Universal stress protein family protein [compost metagenome]